MAITEKRETKFKDTEIGLIPEEWKIVILEEVLETIIDYRGKTPKKTKAGIPLVTAKIVKNGSILEPTEFISEDDYDSWMTRGFPQSGDLVLTTEAPLGEVAILDSKKIALAQRIVTLRGKTDLLSNHYLKYFFQSDIGQYTLKAKMSGTTITGIKQSELRKINILQPPFHEQKAIAEILSSLDEKIELNRRMNKTLEEMGKALFKRWFVDFEFPNEDGKPYKSSGGKMVDSELGEIPEGWEVKPLSQSFDFLEGPGIRNWQYTDAGIKFINIRLIADNNIDVDSANHVSSEEALGKYKHFLLNEKDFIISCSGTLGKSAIVRKNHLPLMLNTSVIRFRPVDGTSYPFMYQYLQSPYFIEEQTRLASGSVQSNFGPTHLNKMFVLKPDVITLEQFNKSLSENINLIIGNSNVIDDLMKVRETLLPRLISGKIRTEGALQ